MGTHTKRHGPAATRSRIALLRGCMAALVLAGASGCLTGGGPAKGEIDPNEATARESTYRTKAERARDQRFSDRLRRQTDLSEPVQEATGKPR